MLSRITSFNLNCQTEMIIVKRHLKVFLVELLDNVFSSSMLVF